MIRKSLVFISVLLLGLFLSGCKKKRVTVEFDLNGGNGTVSKQVIKKNTKAVKPDDPTRDGFDFNGWYLDKDEFSFDVKVIKNIKLVANWKEVDVTVENVTVTFDSGGGSPEPSSQTFKKGNKAVKPQDPALSGFSFDGWFLDNVLFDFDSEVNENITLIAKYSIDPVVVFEVTVSFNLNGGTPLLEDLIIEKGTIITKPADPVKDGYVFVGWYVGDHEFIFSDPVNVDVTLNAKWVLKVATVTVSFDLDGGTPELDDLIIEQGAKIDSPADPVKDGYVFLGWFYGEAPFKFLDPINEDITIYAKWVLETPKVTVTFDLDGGTPLLDPVEVYINFKVDKPANPTKNGFIFMGWYKDEILYDFNRNVEEDITLTAKWEEIEVSKVAVTFDVNGGSPDLETVIINEDTKVNKPADPTRLGYDFLGWHIGEVLFDFDNNVDEDITLVAKWSRIEGHFFVTFDAAGGSPVPEVVLVARGETVELPVAPEMEGYNFSLWFFHEQMRVWNFGSDKVTRDITLTAVYTAKPVYYTVTFNSDLGTEIDPVEVLKGGLITKPADPVRDGFSFLKWVYQEEDRDWDFDVDVVNSNMTLVAIYNINTPNKVTLTFDTDGGTEIAPIKVTISRTPTKPEDPVKEGYVFIGWFLNDIEFNFSAKMYEDTTIKAKYTLITHTVTFDTDGGTEMEPLEVVPGELITKPADPVKEGFIFLNWHYPQGAKFWDFNTDTVMDNVTLVAFYKVDPTNTVTLTFDTDGGTPVAPKEVIRGQFPTKPADPTKEGYKFLGWFIDDVEFSFLKGLTEDTTIKAKWEEIVPFIVTFYYEDGKTGEITIEVDNGDKVTKPADPTKEGFIFLYWNDTDIDEEYDFSLPVDRDLYLYAKWEEIEYIEVYYYTEYDEDGSFVVSIPKGTIPENKTGVFTREGYRFAGWEIDGAKYNFDTPLYDEFTYLNAIWELIVQAYIGEIGFATAEDAANSLSDNETLSLTRDYDGSSFNIGADNVLITRHLSHKVVVKAPIGLYGDFITIEYLEFTDNATITIYESIERFDFLRNKVYDLNINDTDGLNLNQRANIPAFIKAYNTTHNYTINDFVAQYNEFDNINATIFLIGTKRATGSYTFYGNKFTNIKHSAIRIDTDYNDANMYINKNIFKKMEYNAILINSFGDEITGKTSQSIYINNNIFHSVGDELYKRDEELKGPGSIILDNCNPEIPLHFLSNNNDFYQTSVAYYIDNTINPGVNSKYEIYNNIFEGIRSYALQQKYVDNGATTKEVEFTYNTYIGYLHGNDGILDVTPQQWISKNNNFKPYYADDSLMYESEEVNHNVTMYVSSLLDNDNGDIIEALGKSFIYGTKAFNNIQDAVNEAKSNEVIYIDPNGYYTDDILITSGYLTIISNNAGVPYNDNNFKVKTAILEGAITVRGDNVTFDGLRFMGNASIKLDANAYELVGFKFLNNLITNYLGSDEETPFISVHYRNVTRTIKDIYIMGNKFNSADERITFVGDNVNGLYVVNNSFERNFLNNNPAIILQGAKGKYENIGTTGRVFISRNLFSKFNKEAILVDYYNDLFLRITYNDFDDVKGTVIKVNTYDTETDLRLRMFVLSNTFLFNGGDAIAVEVVQANYLSHLRVRHNHFKNEARYYVKNSSGSIQGFVNVNLNKYDATAYPGHFVGVDSFTKVSELPPYVGIVNP